MERLKGVLKKKKKKQGLCSCMHNILMLSLSSNIEQYWPNIAGLVWEPCRTGPEWESEGFYKECNWRAEPSPAVV